MTDSNSFFKAPFVIDSLIDFADITPEEANGDTLDFKVLSSEDLQSIREAAEKWGWSIEWNLHGKSKSDKRASFMDPNAASRAMTPLINLYCTKTKSVKI